MPSQAQLWISVDEFEREYPESLPERLAWWAHRLQVKPALFVRLIDPASGDHPDPAPSLEVVVTRDEDRAGRIDDMLGQILASHDYDLSAMGRTFHRAGDMQGRAARPADGALAHGPASPRPDCLLGEIDAGGPGVLPALIEYLTHPGHA